VRLAGRAPVDARAGQVLAIRHAHGGWLMHTEETTLEVLRRRPGPPSDPGRVRREKEREMGVSCSSGRSKAESEVS
jgi:hypothetical protein